MSAPELGVAALEIAAIVGLVGIVRRAIVGRRSRRRSRPVDPAALVQNLERARYHENLRRIAASDYTPKRHEPDRKDRG